MATKREWLISQGLAKPGRGRLSKVAHDALEKAISEGVEFDEFAAEPEYVPAPIIPWKKTRSAKKIVGYTREGWNVGFDTCHSCSLHINYCSCKQIGLPTIVATVDSEYQHLIALPS